MLLVSLITDKRKHKILEEKGNVLKVVQITVTVL